MIAAPLCRSIRRAGFGGLLVLALAGLGGTVAAAEAAQVVPLTRREQIACARIGESSFVTWKRARGTNRNRSIGAASAFLTRRITHFASRIRALEAKGGSVDAAKRIERLSRRLEDLLHAADNLDDCESGALLERLAAPPSFAFLCRFGFYAPSVATGRECSVDLSRRMIEEALVVADATWSIDATVGILDELLGQACAESGGILLRNLGAGEAAPLYSAYCAESGRRVRTHFLRNTIALGMEEEPTGDCFLARFDAAAAGDPCGGYGLPPAGGGSDPSPPLPDDGDCLIVRMEEEPTGCE